MSDSLSKLQMKTKELSVLCSYYETTYFLTTLASLLVALPKRKEHPALQNLASPLKQIFYAGSLNLRAEHSGKSTDLTSEKWDEIVMLLQDIEAEYSKNIGFDRIGDEPIDFEKIKVVLPTFLSYFCSGPLAYQEQEMERILRTFVHFENDIDQAFGVRPSDFVSFYEFVDSLTNDKLNKALDFSRDERWKKHVEECRAQGLKDPEEWIAAAPEEMAGHIRSMNDQSYLVIVDLNTIDWIDYPKEKFIKIAGLLCCEASPTSELVYYTQRNSLFEKPIYQIDHDRYLFFFAKQLLDASYHFLFDFCKKKDDRIYRQRDKLLEVKVAELFQRFLGKEAFMYKGYYVDGKAEQDILILYKGIALIIECKATNFREPLRDPLKAYDRVKSDFDANIKYGYEQTYRVRSKFIAGKPFDVTDKFGNSFYKVNPRKYENVHSIVVTLERFGMIECDLAALLSIHEDDDYPWAVNIDDLETILLVLAKRPNKAFQLNTYLQYREPYHGHLICDDELELFGLFLSNLRSYKEHSTVEDDIVLEPGYIKPIEEAYRQGLGFLNERYYDAKINKEISFLYV